jgi:signal transduction histidine kinase
MRLRSRFLLLFVAQSLVVAAVSVAVAFKAMGVEQSRAEAELGVSREELGAARDHSLPDAERLRSALAALERERAISAAARLYRSHAVVEAARTIGLFAAASTAAAALLFALASRPLTRRLDELASGAAAASTDRLFRFKRAADPEFGPAFASFNAMLDTIAEQESRLGEAARLDGWREVSSFLFHQLRSPLSALELASRNVSLAASGASDGSIEEGRALGICAGSARSAAAECVRVRALLDRFRDLSGLSLGPPEALDPEALVRACVGRLRPGRAELHVEGPAGAVAPASIQGDRRMLEEALMNLVNNSVEACPSPPARILARIYRERDRVLIEISDSNGPVDPSLPARAGRDRFSTKAEGTGLGLLFVRRVAALHGGSFEAFLTAEGGFGARLALPSAGGAP